MAEDGRSAGKRRVIVPFEVGSFLQAPYGYTQRMRARDRAARGPRTEPTRRDIRILNAAAVALYTVMGIGALLGWKAIRTPAAAVGGAVAALASALLLWTVVMGIAAAFRIARRHPQ